MTQERTPTEASEHTNSVELLGHYGGDETHALSAWTSTSRELDEQKRDRIPGLLRMLAEKGHHTPFEKSALHFLATTDIATHIHIIKHRIGVSVNAESARYKELRDDKFYTPDDWPAAANVSAMYAAHMEDSYRRYHEILRRLEAAGVDRKRAKESARYVLPYANQITSDVQFNFRSFMHFVGLRADAHAQYEVRKVTAWMLAALTRLPGAPFQHSLAAFGWSPARVADLCTELGILAVQT